MEIYRRSIAGAVLQTYHLLPIPFEVKPKTTLNELLNIQESATIGTNEIPKFRYVCLGIGGHKCKTGADGVTLVDPVQHASTDLGLFNMIPFVLRTTDNDLTAAERARYALRRVETHDGLDYFAYYLKRLDFTGVEVKMIHMLVEDGNVTTTEYNSTTDNLKPVPQPIPPSGSTTVNGEYVGASANVTIDIDTFDATEILNAAVIKYGQEEYAYLSEMGLVTGIDRTVVSNDGGLNVTYEEAIAAQIFTHIAMAQAMKSQRSGFRASFDVACKEPMFVLSTP